MKEKKKSMRTYAVYGNTAAAAAELILAEDRKRHFTVIAGGKEQNGDCGMATELTGMGVVVSALIAGDLLDFSRPAAFFFIYSGIFSSGSVGVSVDSDRCISGTFAFHFWSERVY